MIRMLDSIHNSMKFGFVTVVTVVAFAVPSVGGVVMVKVTEFAVFMLVIGPLARTKLLVRLSLTLRAKTDTSATVCPPTSGFR